MQAICAEHGNISMLTLYSTVALEDLTEDSFRKVVQCLTIFCQKHWVREKITAGLST